MRASRQNLNSREQLKRAEKMLSGLDTEITLANRAGNVEPKLQAY
jgi:hypothetical protein